VDQDWFLHFADVPPIDTYRVYPSAVSAPDEYYNRHQEFRNAAYQALKLARVRSTETAGKRRDIFKPVEIGGMVMIFGDQFATGICQVQEITTTMERSLCHYRI